MSRVLCTFPGRAGDLLWALPTVRAIAEHHGDPVDLLIAGEFESMIPLLQPQPYLSRVHADPAWNMAEWKPPTVPCGPRDVVHHLGYRRWPECPLPFEIFQTAFPDHAAQGWGPALERPWITVSGPGVPCEIICGFTEAWFELKLGLLTSVEYLLGSAGPTMQQLTPYGTRWSSEVPPATACVYECDWLDAARAIRNSDLFFGDCSALHVLAVAMGKPVVLCEPMTARHNDIFYPLGKTDRVRLVTGNDGLPTFDARHCATALQEALAHAR